MKEDILNNLKTKSKIELGINLAVLVFYIGSVIGVEAVMVISELIPVNYIILLGILFFLLALIYILLVLAQPAKKKRSILTQIVSAVLSVILIIGSTYVYKLSATVDLLSSSSFQTQAISVIVLDESEIKNVNLLPEKKVGYISFIDPEGMNYAISDIRENVGNIVTEDKDDFDALVNDLYDKKVDAIIVDEAFRSIIEDTFDTFSDDTRVIYQVTIDQSAVSTKDVDVTTEPFVVYISGNDVYGEMTSMGRSDVNMVAVVQPVTHQVLLLSIPRDTYYPLHRNGQYDKFTHTGVYGLQESIDTLQDLLEEDVNYYARLNFTSFINIVDALGGISVYSPVSFITKKGHYSINKGYNDLNAKQALSFVRERKALGTGDFARGKNQQRMISAIIKKICSPAILTKFNDVLDAVSGSIETDMSTSDMNALVKMQLSEMPDWDIQSYQITGDTGMMPCYSVGGKNLSVVIPSETSIALAREYINDMKEGKTIQTEEGDLDKESSTDNTN